MLKLKTHSGFHELFLKYKIPHCRKNSKSNRKTVETEAKPISLTRT